MDTDKLVEAPDIQSVLELIAPLGVETQHSVVNELVDRLETVLHLSIKGWNDGKEITDESYEDGKDGGIWIWPDSEKGFYLGAGKVSLCIPCETLELMPLIIQLMELEERLLAEKQGWRCAEGQKIRLWAAKEFKQYQADRDTVKKALEKLGL